MCNNRCAGKMSSVSAGRECRIFSASIQVHLLSYPTKESMIAERWTYQARFDGPHRAVCLPSFRGMLGEFDGTAKTSLRTGAGLRENLLRWRDC
jgi:hypothetical protein